MSTYPTFAAGTMLSPPLKQYQQPLITQQLTIPFQPQKFYDPTSTNLAVYNNMLVQPYLAIQQPNYHYTQQTPNQDCFSRSMTSPFLRELLDYEIPNTVKLPNLKTYNATTDPDIHIDT